ncbi:MAG: LuxR C-terminal-related transcriptional regulator [Pseudomonadota bacterium]
MLTEREETIALLVAEGKTSKHIARELAISPLTVRTHRRAIFAKLGVHSVADLALLVRQLE